MDTNKQFDISGGVFMRAYEFQVTAHNGVIRIPDEYINKVPQSLKVILLSESVAARQKNFPLMDAPLHINIFKPYDREELYE
jgi:hypothetical protein